MIYLNLVAILIPVFIVGDLVIYPRYLLAIHGTLIRHRLSIASQLMLIGDAIVWLLWGAAKFAESKYGFCIWDVTVGISNIVVWRMRGYDDDLWNSTKHGAKRLAKRLASMRPRVGALRPVAGAV